VRFGITLPQFGPVVAPGLIADFARHAEELGYQSLWVGDRVLAPLRPSRPYPGYTAEKPLPPAFGNFMDPLTVLTSAATVTRTARLGSSTLNATWYHPLLLGRTLTTLDQLSQGRIDAGFGLGWMETEYEALGIPWAGRGARLDETLDVLQAMWTTNPVRHQGKLWEIPPSTLDLRRELRVNLTPGPEMVAGTLALVREARELGYDGVFADPQFAVGSPAEMAGTAEQLMAAYRAG
jgi:alkanesulfonate monooxygenase SsuD/methylene tetrahydromethanopterin reductase-like flavin-dependent oxidoreductase (luciferase family)